MTKLVPIKGTNPRRQVVPLPISLPEPAIGTILTNLLLPSRTTRLPINLALDLESLPANLNIPAYLPVHTTKWYHCPILPSNLAVGTDLETEEPSDGAGHDERGDCPCPEEDGDERGDEQRGCEEEQGGSSPEEGEEDCGAEREDEEG